MLKITLFNDCELELADAVVESHWPVDLKEITEDLDWSVCPGDIIKIEEV